MKITCTKETKDVLISSIVILRCLKPKSETLEDGTTRQITMPKIEEQVEWELYGSSFHGDIISIKCSEQEKHAFAELMSMGTCPFNNISLDKCTKENSNCKECLLKNIRWNIIPAVDIGKHDISDSIYSCLPGCNTQNTEPDNCRPRNPVNGLFSDFCSSVPENRNNRRGSSRKYPDADRRNPVPHKRSDIRQQDILRRPTKPQARPVRKTSPYQNHTERNLRNEKQS